MGTIKMVVGILVMVATVYLIAELAPPYFSNYQFQDSIRNEATLNTYTTKPEDAIRETIYKKAQDLDIPLTKEQIRVKRLGPLGSGSLMIDAEYTIHVNLPGYPLDLQFEAATSNKGVL